MIEELEKIVAAFRPNLKYCLQYNENTCVKEILDMFGLTTDSTKVAVERLNYELGLSSNAPEPAPPALGPTQIGMETRAERLHTVLGLIKDAYRELAQEMLNAGGDVAELERRVSQIIGSGWFQNLG